MLDYRVRTFLEVYRLRSYTKAAAKLLITQPAVSQHIHHLESHYGCALFAKSGRAIVPTAAGDILYQRLSVMCNDESRIERDVRAAADPHAAAAQTLRLGCTKTVGDHLAPGLLAQLLASHPDQTVRMRCANTRDLVQKIEAGTLDCALVEGSFDRQRFAWENIATEAYIAVGAPGTPRPAHAEDLLTHRLILREAGSGTREILERYLATRDLDTGDFATTIEIEGIPAIKACVAAGAGISFMYRFAAASELEHGTLVDVTPPDMPIEHDIRLMWQRGSQYANRYRAIARLWRKG